MPSASISPQIKPSRRTPKAPPVPEPSAEIVASAKRRGYDWIECRVGEVRLGYYCFLDGAWIGRNKRGGLPQTVSAACRALDAARAAQQGVTPEDAARNWWNQSQQYAGD